MGVVVGILGQSIYDLIQAILLGNSQSENVDFVAGVGAAAAVYVALRLSGLNGKD